jgi:DNA-binding CsgD family transcriptional regulator
MVVVGVTNSLMQHEPDPQPSADGGSSSTQSAALRAPLAVVGVADSGSRVERLSSTAEALFASPIGDLVGRPFTSLIADYDVPNCLVAMVEATTTRTAVSAYLDIRTGSGPEQQGAPPVGCEIAFLPLEPPPSCAFVLLPRAQPLSRDHISMDLGLMLSRLRRGGPAGELTRRPPTVMTDRTVAGLARLTSRELGLLTRILQGDRVPTIAAELFLSQSTIRSHLASIFRKLEVNSQPELVRLFRSGG